MFLQVPEWYHVDNIIANSPYSTHILFHFNIYNFSLKWHNLITYASDGHYRFIDALRMSLTMRSKRIFYSLLLKILTGQNVWKFKWDILCAEPITQWWLGKDRPRWSHVAFGTKYSRAMTHLNGRASQSGACFSYRKVRFSLLKIVLYDFSVSRSCDVRKYLRKSRKTYDNLRGHRKFTNDVFGPLLHGNVG